MPLGFIAAISAAGVLKWTMVEYTLHSRMRRAMTCVYCEPKSRMTICSFMELKNRAQIVQTPARQGERKMEFLRRYPLGDDVMIANNPSETTKHIDALEVGLYFARPFCVPE